MNKQVTPPTPQLRTCLASRDISEFALLIEDLDSALGENWGELNLHETSVYLTQADAARLEFLLVALDEDDRANLPLVKDILIQADAIGLPTILAAEDLTEGDLADLMTCNVAEFLPYPMPEGALEQAIARLQPAPEPKLATPTHIPNSSQLFAVQGLVGGTGATTLAVNLANELSLEQSGSVCLIDLDLQFGGIGGNLDLLARPAGSKLLTKLATADSHDFLQSLQGYGEGLSVLTAPAEFVSLHMLTPAGIDRLLTLARMHFDYVVVDMPKALFDWSKTVHAAADTVFCPLQLDLRSAQAATRFRAKVLDEKQDYQKFEFVMNKAPQFTDLTGRGRVKRLGEVLARPLTILLPNGGNVIAQTADMGATLAEAQSNNAYRKEVQRLARSLLITPTSQAALAA